MAEDKINLLGLLAEGSQKGFFNFVKKLSGAEEGELGAELSRQQRQQPRDALGFGDYLGLLGENVFGSPGAINKPRGERPPNTFFDAGAAENPAPGGNSDLVNLFRSMQSNNPDRSSIEDFVLQLMLHTALGKAQLPESAVQPQVNIPEPILPNRQPGV